MKRQWKHPETRETGRDYWRSLGELEDSPEFRDWLGREFPQGAAELEADDVSRRNFVKLMGAATALAGFGLTGCRRPVRHLVPYNDHVEWVIPGHALYYASAKPRLNGRGCDPLVVTTYEGRPTRVDGNRLHPQVSGGSNAFTQASVLDLYDPDRSREYLQSGAKSSAGAFQSEFLSNFRKARSGEGVAFLISENTSPTRARLLDDVVARYAGAQVFSYDALAPAGLKAAEAELFGEGVAQVPHFDMARKILSIDCDFLGLDPQGVDSAIEFTRGRRVDGRNPNGEMNRLYSIESAFTLTGGMADHRYRLPGSQMLKVAVLLAVEIAKAAGDAALGGSLTAAAAKFNHAVFNREWIAECARDLAASKGKALVVAGSGQPKEMHLLIAAINAALGAFDGGPKAVIDTVKTGVPALPGVAELVQAIDGGKIKTLFITSEADPVFDAPIDLNIAEALAKAGSVIHLGVRKNLTARAATWHVPGTHYLESWGDWQTITGLYSVQQPMIQPLNDGISEIEFLLELLKEEGAKEPEPAPAVMPGMPEPDGPALAAVKETFASLPGAKKEDWEIVLRDGFAKGTAFEAAGAAAVDAGKATSALAKVDLPDWPHPESLEINFVPGSGTWDGRFANNGWLQEAADPITKLTWDNAALMGQNTAAELGYEIGDMITLTVGDASIEVPVLINPGQSDYTIQLALGYYGNRKDIGNVARGVGFDVAPLRVSATPFYRTGVTAASAHKRYDLALTAEHYSMEGRAIVREGTLDMFKKDPAFARKQGMDAHIPENISLYKGPDYESSPDDKQNRANSDPAIDGHAFRVDPLHQWTMTIDLHSCIGCNACTVACQSENNIPIVGKGQVIAGREMHWIRMDRYFSSPVDTKTVSENGLNFKEIGRPGKRKVDEDAVEMLTQPVACQQCEIAPCETVCPVNATVHTGDGLNAMTYNRCIGTRYCANNCPYKARRFNFFDYNKRPLKELYWGPLAPAAGHATTTEQLQKNPNVTVRMRGVIEKCTYCVQRISAAKVAAKVAARDSDQYQVPANSLRVACQDACPTAAIDFGNFKNPGDRVNEARADSRNYDLLKYIGARPRTSYLARVKNPNPKMPGAEKIGRVTAEMH